jgi:hypothetical protein
LQRRSDSNRVKTENVEEVGSMVDDSNSENLIHRLIDTGVASRTDGADHLSPSQLAGASASREALSLAQLARAIGEGRDVPTHLTELAQRGKSGPGIRTSALPLLRAAVGRLEDGVFGGTASIEDAVRASALLDSWRSRDEVAPV